MRRTYGIRNDAWKASPYTSTYISLKPVRGPSSVMFAADSYSSNTYSQVFNFDGGFGYWYGGNSSASECIAAPHGNTANLWFLDGHAANMKPVNILVMERSRWRDSRDKYYGNPKKPDSIKIFNSNYVKITFM